MHGQIVARKYENDIFMCQNDFSNHENEHFAPGTPGMIFALEIQMGNWAVRYFVNA